MDLRRWQWEALGLAGLVVTALSLWGVAQLQGQLGPGVARGRPEGYLLIALAALALIPFVRNFYRYEWHRITGGRGGGLGLVLFLLVGVACAMVLNATRLALL